MWQHIYKNLSLLKTIVSNKLNESSVDILALLPLWKHSKGIKNLSVKKLNAIKFTNEL